MFGASVGFIPHGNAYSVLTGPSGVATGGAVIGGSVQGNNAGWAWDVGYSNPGGAVGGGYGFKIFDSQQGDQVATQFHDKQGNPLPRCY